MLAGARGQAPRTRQETRGETPAQELQRRPDGRASCAPPRATHQVCGHIAGHDTKTTWARQVRRGTKGERTPGKALPHTRSMHARPPRRRRGPREGRVGRMASSPSTAAGRLHRSRRGGGACCEPPRRWATRRRGPCATPGTRRGSGNPHSPVDTRSTSRPEAAGTGRTRCSRCIPPGRCHTSRRGGASAPARGPPLRHPVPWALGQSPEPGPSRRAPRRPPARLALGSVRGPYPSRTGRRRRRPPPGQAGPPSRTKSTTASSPFSLPKGCPPVVASHVRTIKRRRRPLPARGKCRNPVAAAFYPVASAWGK